MERHGKWVPEGAASDSSSYPEGLRQTQPHSRAQLIATKRAFRRQCLAATGPGRGRELGRTAEIDGAGGAPQDGEVVAEDDDRASLDSLGISSRPYRGLLHDVPGLEKEDASTSSSLDSSDDDDDDFLKDARMLLTPLTRGTHGRVDRSRTNSLPAVIVEAARMERGGEPLSSSQPANNGPTSPLRPVATFHIARELPALTEGSTTEFLLKRPPGWRDQTYRAPFSTSTTGYSGRRRSITVGERYPNLARRFSFAEAQISSSSESDSDDDSEIVAEWERAQAFSGQAARWGLFQRYRDSRRSGFGDRVPVLVSDAAASEVVFAPPAGTVAARDAALLELEAATMSPRALESASRGVDSRDHAEGWGWGERPRSRKASIQTAKEGTGALKGKLRKKGKQGTSSNRVVEEKRIGELQFVAPRFRFPLSRGGGARTGLRSSGGTLQPPDSQPRTPPRSTQPSSHASRGDELERPQLGSPEIRKRIVQLSAIRRPGASAASPVPPIVDLSKTVRPATRSRFDDDLSEPISREQDASSLTARARYVQHCALNALAPEPLIISRSDHHQLQLAHYGLGNAKATALSAGLDAMPHLYVADLTNNRLSGRGVRAIVSALQRHAPDLHTLNLAENDVDIIAVRALAEMLRTTTALTALTLSSCKIGDAAVAPLCAAAQKNTSVTHLSLDHNAIGSRGGAALALIVESHRSIQYLDLSWNQLRGAGALAIANSLEFNLVLRSLNLAWNGFGGDAARQIGESLALNKTLRSLDLSQNGIGQDDAFVVANGLSKNTSLNSLHLNGNPIGGAGCRALMRTLDMTGDVRNIELSNCRMDGTSGPVPFDPSNPAGMYKLDMRNPVDKVVMDEILRAFAYLPGTSITSCTVINGASRSKVALVAKETRAASIAPSSLSTSRPATPGDAVARDVLTALPADGGDGPTVGTKRVSIDFSKSDPETMSPASVFSSEASVDMEQLTDSEPEVDVGQVSDEEAVNIPEDDLVVPPEVVVVDGRGDDWTPPAEGWVEVTVEFRPRKVQKWQRVKTSGMEALMSSMAKHGFDRREKKNLLNIASADLYFSCQQATNLLSAYGADESHEKVDAVFSLLPRLTDPENESTFIRANLRPAERRVLDSKLGQLTTFHIENPTGHYRLDLSNETDRMLFGKLQIINGEEVALAKRNGFADTSQYGTWDGFRNGTLSGEPFLLTGDFTSESVGNEGILEFDFVSTTVAPAWARPMRKREFAKFLRRVQRIVAEAERVNIAGIAAASAAANEGTMAEARRGSKAGIHGAHPLAPSQITSLLSTVRDGVYNVWLKSEQAVRLVQAVPPSDPGVRVEVCIAIFGRMQKLADFIENILPLVPESAVPDVWQRIGWLNLFNPSNPDHYWSMDLSVREQRLVTVALVDLAIAEPGENWEGECYNDIAGWELPSSWIEEVPDSGMLTLTYTSTGPGCAPDWDCRKELLSKFLLGRCGLS